jgi:hypothetical protein
MRASSEKFSGLKTLFGIRDSRFSADQKLAIAGAANVHSRFANSDLFLLPRIYN